MEINKKAMEAIKQVNIKGKELHSLLIQLKEEMEKIGAGEIEFTLGFDKNDQAKVGELVPKITIGLYEKEEMKDE